MTSAVEQLTNKHAAGRFVSICDASKLQNCVSPQFWFNEEAASESRNSTLLCEKASQAFAGAFVHLKGQGKAFGALESDSKIEEKVAMPHWLSSDLVQVNYCEGHSKIDVVPYEAPCTPMQSFHRQKYRPDETPESVGSLPSLSIGFSSAKKQSEETVDCYGMENHHTPSLMSELPSSQQTHQQQDHERPYQIRTSTPSKTFDRLLQGLQREGPEYHKENLLSLSLAKHEKIETCKKSDHFLPFGQCSGQPQRILARLAGPRRSTPPEVVHSQQAKTQLLTSHKQSFSVYSSPSFSSDSNSLKSAKAGKGDLKPSVSLELSVSAVVLDGNNPGNQQQPEGLKSAIQTLCIPAELTSEYSHGNLNLQMKSLLDALHSGESNGNFPVRVTSHVLGNKPASLLAQSPVEGGRCFPLLQSHLDDGADQQDFMNDQGGYAGLNNCGKRQRSSFSWDQLQNERRFDSKESPLHFVEDAKRYHKEAKMATKKKAQAAAEDHITPFGRAEVPCTSMWHGGTGQDEHSQPKGMRKHITFTDNGDDESLVDSKKTCGMPETQPDNENATAGFHMAYVQKQEAENVVTATLSMEGMLDISASGLVGYEKRLSDPLKESSDKQAVGLKLYTTPAYSQMPRTLSTFSTGEPSLPLSLELSQKLPDLGGGKVQSQQFKAASDTDWGKFLALSATSDISGADTDGSVPPYQQRFKQLQAFLKLCDESDQKDHLLALRSLSAAARSGHAVDLETRAIMLSLEEGKEMNRMKNLNVLGRNGIDAGNTPQAPRLPVPGAASTTKL